MVKGIEVFQEFFHDCDDAYIIIGGLATAMVMNELGFVFRATKDIDMVVVVQDNEAFLKKLLQFIDLGGYETRQRTENPDQHNLFRFLKPADKSYPDQIELFAIHSNDSILVTDHHIIPIETPENYPYLSAILLDADYFDLLVQHADNIDGIRVASAVALIPLKIHAHLNLKKSGHSDAKKHLKDIIRLAAILQEEDRIELSGLPEEEFALFLPLFEEVLEETVVDVLENNQIYEVFKDDIVSELKRVYRNTTEEDK